MQYKTLTLGLIEARPALHRRLKRARKLLPTMEAHARELRAGHRTWNDTLTRLRPGDDPRFLANEALELALAELAERLAAEDSATASGGDS
jgi:hypothetical protein